MDGNVKAFFFCFLNLCGFVTCLILRLDPDGTCTIANAGHLPPFLNHHELNVPPALPLGLVASAGYVGRGLGTDLLGDLRARIAELAATTLTPVYWPVGLEKTLTSSKMAPTPGRLPAGAPIFKRTRENRLAMP